MKRTKIIAIIAIVFSISLIITLIVINIRPYLRVSQVVSNPTEYDNLEIQVIGIVDGFSGGDFNLTENAAKILVDVSQITVPSELKNGIEIVVVGQFNISLILKASQILVQCS